MGECEVCRWVEKRARLERMYEAGWSYVLGELLVLNRRMKDEGGCKEHGS